MTQRDIISENDKMKVPEDVIASKIFLIRGLKVMLDRDLAGLYQVETRVLNQAVRRNKKRFPPDFMFELTKEEMTNWMSQIVISNREKMGLRKPPLAFTEQGVAMMSSVLNSERAILMNIQIIRVFTKIRELLGTHKEIMHQPEEIRHKDQEQDRQIKVIFEYLRQLEQQKKNEEDLKARRKIGFRNE